MNPALPGGANGTEARIDDDVWSVGARVGYAFVPYGRLQQGTSEAPNPNALRIDVHLGTLQARVTAPTATTLDLQLPFGSLVTRSVAMNRTDPGVGDLELRIRQGFTKYLHAPAITTSLGLAVPTGPYVARSGSANLTPEASYLTLGRGTTWWIAEVDGRLAVHPRVATFSQLSARGPLARTSDGFSWGTELRATLGADVSVRTWLSFVASVDLQWRGGASEPDPFSTGRLDTANAGGTQWTVTPAAAFSRGSLSLIAGVRIPIRSDVAGNQLVPQTGALLALSYATRLTPRKRPPPIEIAPGKITVVDYWAAWCAPCAEISRALEAATARWPDVRVVTIDATAWPSDDAPALPAGVTGLPVVEIFDRTGVRTHLLTGASASRVVETVDQLRAKP